MSIRFQYKMIENIRNSCDLITRLFIYPPWGDKEWGFEILSGFISRGESTGGT